MGTSISVDPLSSVENTPRSIFRRSIPTESVVCVHGYPTLSNADLMEAYTEKAENQWENVGSDLSSFVVPVIAVTEPSVATMNPPYPAACKLRLKWVTSSGGDSLCKLTGSNFKSVMEVITESSTQFHSASHYQEGYHLCWLLALLALQAAE